MTPAGTRMVAPTTRNGKRQKRRWILGILAAIGLLAHAPAVARAAGPSWSPPVQSGTNTWSAPVYLGSDSNAVSCVSRSFCVEASAIGNVAIWNGTAWGSQTGIEGSHNLSAVSCASSSFCAAVDFGGNALTWSGGSWSGPVPIAGIGELDSVSCSSASFCVAVDGGGNASTWTGSSWSAATNIDPGGGLTVSCTSSSFCVAVDSSKDGSHTNALMWNGSTWSAPLNIDPGGGGLPSVSCSSPSFCVAIDGNGNALTWSGSSWSAPVPIGETNGETVSCSSAIFCTVVGLKNANNVVTWNGTSWTTPLSVDAHGNGFSAVSCTSSTFCAAADFAGNALTYAIAAATRLSSSHNPSTAGQSVTFTASVSPASGSVEPTGTVAFSDGGSGIPGCSAQLLSAARKARCTVHYTSQGSHSISAAYSGDSNFAGSISASLDQVVN